MSKIKKFFMKKKEEAAFKLKLGGSMGQGHSLTASESGPTTSQRKPSKDAYIPPKRNEISEEARVAAAAALARFEKRDTKEFNTSLAAIKAQAKRELEAERKLREEQAQAMETRSSISSITVAEDKNLACQGVFFRCPMISDEILPKEQWRIKIKEFLYQQLEEERALTSCLIIWNCNTKEKAEEAIKVMTKYLENIASNPGDEKFFKIRMSNKIYSEKVQKVEGALEFLKAAGFREVVLDDEPFLLWSEENVEKDFDLPSLLEALNNAEIIPLTLDRNIKVLLPSQVRKVALPDDFYRISPEEIKREQQLRAEALKNAQVLRTKAMREREEQRNLRMYRYALIRVKFPDGIYIQGTFNVYETMSDVYEFVQSCLENESLDFSLATAGEGKFVQEDMEKTLADLRLVPSVVLLFTIPGANMAAASDAHFLKDELLLLIQAM